MEKIDIRIGIVEEYDFTEEDKCEGYEVLIYLGYTENEVDNKIKCGTLEYHSGINKILVKDEETKQKFIEMMQVVN